MEENTGTAALLCGFGKREITPPIGTPLVGHYKQRFAKGVLDPLYVRAALFESAGTRAVIFTMDILLVQEEWATRIRKKVGKTYGVDPDAVLITSSHTHTGPMTTDDTASGKKVDPEYVAFLEEQAFCAAGDACADLAPARLFYAEKELPGISFIRRYRMKDGTVKTNPKDGTDIDHPEGKPNETLRLLQIRREGADDIYMVNFGTHADTIGGEYISADWPGFLCSILERAIPGSKCMFLLGPEGDANHVTPFKENKGRLISERKDEDVRETAAHARYMGRAVAGQILTMCDRAEEIGNEGVAFAAEEMQLPSNKNNEEIDEARRINGIYMEGRAKEEGIVQVQIARARRVIRNFDAPPFFTYHAYAIRIGALAFVGVPGEPFTELGFRIYAASPFAHTIVFCTTNASCGYVPTSSAFEVKGSYETNVSRINKGSDDAYVQAAERALKALKK